MNSFKGDKNVPYLSPRTAGMKREVLLQHKEQTGWQYYWPNVHTRAKSEGFPPSQGQDRWFALGCRVEVKRQESSLQHIVHENNSELRLKWDQEQDWMAPAWETLKSQGMLDMLCLVSALIIVLEKSLKSLRLGRARILKGTLLLGTLDSPWAAFSSSLESLSL